MVKAPNHPPTLATAHDVRHLAKCGHCGDLMDDRESIALAYPQSECAGSRIVDIHPSCAAKLMPFKELLKLPMEALRKFTIADLGVKKLRAVITEVDKRLKSDGRHCAACDKPGGTAFTIFDGNKTIGRAYVHSDCLARAKKAEGRTMKKIRASAAAMERLRIAKRDAREKEAS